MPTSHTDTFARDRLPPPELQPEFIFELPELQFPSRLNCASELLDKPVREGRGDRVCIRSADVTWTYRDLQRKADQIASVLVREMGLQAGMRVLLRAPNKPMLAACWFAVMKAGAIAVATMPLLRAKELEAIIEIGQISHALCDAALADELNLAASHSSYLRQTRCFNSDDVNGLEFAMERQPAGFNNVETFAEDICILGFTSGTTGVPKGTLHHHRDVMAICRCWVPHVLKPRPDDVFIGSPPLAFTFGLGGLLLFPMSVSASTVLLEKCGPNQLVDGIKTFGATVLFTAPTSYRAMAARGAELRLTPLRQCVSAGEALPASTRSLWKQATGIELIDGIGATEMLHIFISADEANARPGATGLPVPGYRAEIVDDLDQPVPVGTVGRLRVKGPTGCRYLADPRQASYVKGGWNYTSDAYFKDEDGYFHFHARIDDMIVSAGYNIASPEVEEALMQHPAVAECGVIGVSDAERGQIVKAFVVLRPGFAASPDLAKTLQDFVKQTVAPYKYPRALEFLDSLPRTETGKLQRFRLKDMG